MKNLITCFLMGMICMFLLVAKAETVYASSLEASTLDEDSITNEVDESNNNAFPNTSPWMKDATDESIYSNSIDASDDEPDISVKSPGMVEKYFAELIRNVASSLIDLLHVNIGASLDGIVYGRVGSGYPNKVNIYGFELRKGNPYGVTASVAYALVRGMAYIFLAVSFVFMLAKASWSGQTARSREEIKSNLPMLIYKFVLLALMPHLLDMALYVRDIVLYGIKEVTGQMVTGGATLSLSKAFLINAERSGTVVDAMMYLGTAVLTIYFVFIYVAVAIDLLICFVSFPFVCVFQSAKRDLVSNWMMNVLSNVLNPVIDAILLLVPLLTSVMLSDAIKGVSIIQLVMCMLIIPARGKVKSLLGIQSNERNGFMGIMALMGLGRALMGKIKKGVGRIGDIASDVQKSRMHGELSEVDKEEEESLLSGYGGNNGENGHGGAEDLDFGDSRDPVSDSGNNRDMEDELEAKENGLEEEPQDIDGYGLENNNEAADALTVDAAEDAKAGMTDIKEEQEDGSIAEKSVNANQDDSNEGLAQEAENEQTAKRSRNEIISDLDNQVEKGQANIDGLRSEKAALMRQDKALQRQMLDQKRGSQEYKKLERARADTAVKSAEVEQKIADESRNINALKNQSKLLKSAGQAGGNHASNLTSFEEKRAEILLKRANINNFEQPEFKNVLSNEQMQKLYRRRAYANTGKLAAGIGGAAAGGALAGGAAIFMQPSTVATAAVGGALFGSELGEAGVNAAMASYRYGMPAVSNSLKGIKNTAVAAANNHANAKVREAAQKFDFNEQNAEAPVMKEPMAQPPITSTPVRSDGNEGQAMHTQHAEADMQNLQQQVRADVSKAVQRVISPDGQIKNSIGLKAIQRANVEAEKAFATLKETTGSCPPEIIREKRVHIQTEFMTEEILKKLTTNTDYEKGSLKYKEAENYVREKVGKIIEDKNRSMF